MVLQSGFSGLKRYFLSFHLCLHFLSTLQACFATWLDSANLFTALLCSEAFPFVPVSPCPGHNSYRYLMTSVWICMDISELGPVLWSLNPVIPQRSFHHMVFSCNMEVSLWAGSGSGCRLLLPLIREKHPPNADCLIDLWGRAQFSPGSWSPSWIQPALLWRYSSVEETSIQRFFFVVVFNRFIYWLHRAACGILIPQPGIEPAAPALEERSLNHWTTREVQYKAF